MTRASSFQRDSRGHSGQRQAQTFASTPAAENGGPLSLEQARVVDDVLELLAAAIWADFQQRAQPDGQDPQGNQP